MSTPLSRRTFFGLSGAVGTLGLVAACSSGQPSGSSNAPTAGASGGILPTYQPNETFPADLTSTNADVSAAYFAYSNEDGEPFGLSTKAVYEQMAKPPSQQSLPLTQVRPDGEADLYLQWAQRPR